MNPGMTRVINEPYLSRIKTFLLENLGLLYTAKRDNELSRKIWEVAIMTKHKTAESYINWLLSPRLRRADLELLASYITIGETYFLREGEAFDYLRNEYLNNFIYHNRKAERRLTVWSAGCSSGEEVYSLAGLIREMLPDREKWQVRILGTDINPLVLEKARAGVYSKWSFRKTPKWFMKYVEEDDENRYRICDCLKEMVEFRSHNLATEPALLSGVNIIFCRNVLIYFSQELIRKITAGFYDALVEEGLLVLSPVEVSLNICERFIRRFYAGRSFFIRNSLSSEPFIHSGIERALPEQIKHNEKSSPVASAEVDPESSAAEKGFERLRFLYREGLYLRVDNLISQRAKTLLELPAEFQELLIKSKMKQNKYDEAELLCQEIIKAEQSQSTIFFLLALMQIKKKVYKLARQTLEHIITMEPGYVLAYYQSGILAHQRGDIKERDRCFAEVERLLENSDQRELIDDYLDLIVSDIFRKMKELREEM
ncbi:MAG: hypothetical protein K9M99_01700 [Candidatus Cloacimonetes bacterium]|nr:hypothetical protein [Candidatus Cloacimonadota bacterium]